MKGSSFGYLMKEGARSLWVNRLMSVASIGVLAACLILVGAAGLFAVNINSVVSYVEDQNEVVVFADDGMTEAELETLDLEISMLENVGDYEFISSQQAYELQKERMGEMGELLEAYEDEEELHQLLPPTFRVQIKDLSIMDETRKQLENLEHVQKVNAESDMAATLTSVRQIVAVSGAAIVIILVVVSLIIIANTIKLTVFNRRKEINIMKYVGATDAFIQLPFEIEGLLLGLLSAAIAYFAVWGGYYYVMDWLRTVNSLWIQDAYQYFLPFSQVAQPLLIVFSGLGIGIGVIGSMVFVRKYLKV